jgi:hypothetical protein
MVYDKGLESILRLKKRLKKYAIYNRKNNLEK